jgi:transcriptional regulator with XRE-family HTH domain
MSAKKPPRIPLPKQWKQHVRMAVVHVISLAHFSLSYARGWAADSVNTRVRLKAENDRLRQEVALLREELRIKDARMARIDPHRRPYYAPTDRLAILQLRAARGWSLEQTAKAFLVTAATIATWVQRVDEAGPAALLQLPEPVNKFPDFVCHLARAAEDPLSDDGQKEDRRNTRPRRASIWDRLRWAGCSRNRRGRRPGRSNSKRQAES